MNKTILFFLEPYYLRDLRGENVNLFKDVTTINLEELLLRGNKEDMSDSFYNRQTPEEFKSLILKYGASWEEQALKEGYTEQDIQSLKMYVDDLKIAATWDGPYGFINTFINNRLRNKCSKTAIEDIISLNHLFVKYITERYVYQQSMVKTQKNLIGELDRVNNSGGFLSKYYIYGQQDWTVKNVPVSKLVNTIDILTSNDATVDEEFRNMSEFIDITWHEINVDNTSFVKDGIDILFRTQTPDITPVISASNETNKVTICSIRALPGFGNFITKLLDTKNNKIITGVLTRELYRIALENNTEQDVFNTSILSSYLASIVY